MADQKQHAKITPEMARIADAIVDGHRRFSSEGLQLLADALRDARLDEQREYTLYPIAHYYKSITCKCQKCRRIIALERGEA